MSAAREQGLCRSAAARDRLPPVLPARERAAHRQVPAWRAGPGGHAAREAARALTDELFDELEALEAFAKERGRTLLELAFAGLPRSLGVASVIAGATKPEQVRANAAAGEWELSEQNAQALRALLEA